MWQYHAIKLISKITMLLPGPVKTSLGKALGRLFWLIAPPWRKRMAVGQIKDCLGFDDKKAWRVAKESVLQYGEMIVEMLCFPLLNKDNVKEKIVFSDEAAAKALFAKGNGVVMASAHFGNWELYGAAMPLYGYKLAAVAQKQHNDAMDRFINEYRALTGMRIIYRTSVLEMARLLDEGYGIGLLTDQDGGKDGVTVDFFGRPTSCHKGPVVLARLKKAPLVLALLKKRADGRHEVFVSPPIELSYSKDREKDVKEGTAVLMKMLADEIKKDPSSWFWLHNRWKVGKEYYK